MSTRQEETEMAAYDYSIGNADEDGMCTVSIYGPERVERFSVRRDMARQWVEQEMGLREAMDEGGTCEHGLAAALCAGPMHYPA